MARALLFNPENDLALAAGTPNYTPPLAARRLREAGQTLPLWYGSAGDRVITHGVNARWFDTMTELFTLQADLYDHRSATALTPEPWGWSAAARRNFINENFDLSQLPDDTLLEHLRQLSHRRTAIEINRRLRNLLDFEIAPEAVEIDNPATLADLLAEDSDMVIKAPWSSTGRGIIDCRTLSPDEVIRHASGIISKQGSVMAEHAYDRLADFAMLFHSDGRHCRFAGLSLFDTDPRGAYTGNIIAPQNYLADRLAATYPAERLTATAAALEQVLSEVISPLYSGSLGVDMLIAGRGDGRPSLLDATVELNLRRTMGFVALSLAENYIAEGSTGHYAVIPGAVSADAQTVVESHKLVSGRILLTEPNPYFSFVFEAQPVG